MSRPLSAAMAEALACGRPILLLAEIEHPSAAGGMARFWSGIGKLSWDGHDWTGAGRLGAVTPIRHTSDLKIQEIGFNLTGLSPGDVSGLADDVRNLAGRAWLASLDDSGAVIPDPMQVVDSQLDFQSFSADDSMEVKLTITARTGFYTLERAIDERWSSEDQKQTYPTDSGLDFLAELQNQALQWKPV